MDNTKKTDNAIEPIEGQDFAKPEEEDQKPSSHGEVANQKGSDFTDLEESRMDHPPKHRDTNGSTKDDTDKPKNNLEQEKGV
ncbi:hypothetical protein [Pedobacter jejuensis]|uniref:Uncharacterized protein n=1 Tax=Pedobacter jejuensis TaxID=1268550 RepID=A0A3N0BQR1_9SPHI|nr:hypothetical protein [Pedobacter jejuensis]RNL51296.1 hypothetical protein D7004_16420 [Pedobacter jejuensis]